MLRRKAVFGQQLQTGAATIVHGFGVPGSAAELVQRLPFINRSIDTQQIIGFGHGGGTQRICEKIVIALLLGLLPLPGAMQPLRPYWLALIVAYWVIEAPDTAGLGFAFVLRLIADLMFGGLLGEQALRLVIMTFILQRFRARLRFFPMSQQALAIGVLLFNDRVVTSAVHLALGEPTLPWNYWWAPLLGMLLWPPLFLLLDALRLGKRK